MADIDLIASDDSPFDPWVREAAKAARDALQEIRAVLEGAHCPDVKVRMISETVARGLGEQ